MEQHSDGGTIFVYLDPLWRDFGDWGFLGGWLLGPEGWNAEGMADLIFTERLMDFVESQYCIDRDRVFATGHSWGGDMAHVVACFLGDRFRAAAPAAANQPYWFGGRQFGEPFCPGETAIWTFFGIEDDHFNVGSAYGDACRDFWLEENACTGVEAHARLDFGPQEQCFEYQGCSANTRYCLYGPEARHQIPSYFSQAVIAWFEGF
jgi:polyhydroxybutyrate depolymerase